MKVSLTTSSINFYQYQWYKFNTTQYQSQDVFSNKKEDQAASKPSGPSPEESAPDKWQKKTSLDLSKSSQKRSENFTNKKDDISLKEKLRLEKLRQRDREVRTHEMAHVLAGGPYILGGPHYIFVVGPDGKLYAVGGEVKIDLSPVPNNPDATIRKAETIKRAALAPANPSAQDRAVAAKAEQMAMKARMEKLKKQREKLQQNSKEIQAGQGPFLKHTADVGGIISYIEQFHKKIFSHLATKAYSLNNDANQNNVFEQIV